MRSIWLALGMVCGVVWGCGGPNGVATSAGTGASGTGGAGTMTSSSGSIGSTSSGTGATGLPCDVQMVLQSHCWSCHGPTPAGGAPESLVTLAQLSAPSKSNPSMSYAQVAVARINDPVSPMPPKPDPGVPPAEKAVFETWVNAGLPAGTCDGGTGGAGTGGTGTGTGGTMGAGGDPYDTPPVCSSNTFWTNGDSGSASMHPGRACKTCHVVGGKASGKTFDIAGTVYPTAHEPDDCNGVNLSNVQVIITDANGQDHPLSVNSAGNFYHQDFFGFAAFPPPIKAKVVYNGQERAMSAAQTSGDCNSCHTEDGANNAPGRIMLP